MQTVYVPVKDDLTNGLQNRLRVMTPSTNLLDFVEKTEAVLLTKEDAEKIKAALSLVHVADNRHGLEHSIFTIEEFKQLGDALTILNKNL